MKTNAEYQKEYREKNKEKLRATRLNKYEENKEKFLRQSREYYLKNRSEIVVRRAQERRDLQFKEKNNKYKSEWYKKNKNKARLAIYKWKKENKHKTDVHSFVMFGVKIGYIQKPDKCSECAKEGKIHAHHEDYNKPLDVIWLCEACHGEKHKKYR